MSCRYCGNSSENLKLCQVRANNRDPWHHPFWLCKSCRKYLRGLFRYCPKDVAERYGF